MGAPSPEHTGIEASVRVGSCVDVGSRVGVGLGLNSTVGALGVSVDRAVAVTLRVDVAEIADGGTVPVGAAPGVAHANSAPIIMNRMLMRQSNLDVILIYVDGFGLRGAGAQAGEQLTGQG